MGGSLPPPSEVHLPYLPYRRIQLTVVVVPHSELQAVEIAPRTVAYPPVNRSFKEVRSPRLS